MLFSKHVEPIKLETGIFHYLRSDGENKKRLHLRVEEDGNSILLVNASRIYHFNPSASFIAKAYLDNLSDEAIIQGLVQTFQVKKNKAAQDYHNFKEQIALISSPSEDACPFCDLNVEIQAPFSHQLSAPYRMDLAITYACNNDCAHCYNVKRRALNRALSLEEWQETLKRIWDVGIPHVVFTGGEPTLVAFLPQLIQQAERLGLITGLNTNGRLLKEKDFVHQLVEAGLDHVQITLESHEPSIHDHMVRHAGAWQETVEGIRNALETPLYVMTNTTLIQSNSIYLPETLQFLNELGVKTIGLNGIIHSGRGCSFEEELDESALPPLLKTAQEITAHNGQQLIWYTPTRYCQFDPILMGLGVKGCTAALYNMCIEPNGDVIPCQSYYTPLGNILHSKWDEIWNNELAISLREKKLIPPECHTCAILNTCGGSCPLIYMEKGNLPTYELQNKF